MKRKFIILCTMMLALVMLCTACGGYTAPEETVAPIVTPEPLAAQSEPADDGAAFDYKVSGAITNDMVFQRNQYINVYGTSDTAGGIVYADFKGVTRWAKVDENGQWLIQFDAQEASAEPVELVVYNKSQGAEKGVKFTNILIGDVWIVAGQSNAQVALESTLDNNPEFISTVSADDNIRVFTQWYWDYVGTYFVEDETAVYQKAIEQKPLDNPAENTKWQVADQEVAKGFSAVGYYFAKKVSDETDIPIGMIQAPAGGAALHAFIPSDVYNEADHKKGVSIFEPTDVYNCMLAPFAKTSIAGMLWYQGEANESVYYTYSDDLKEFVGMMRDIWGDNMAFYNVQITSHNDTNNAWPNIAEIRYEQAELIGEVDNYYLVCTMDYGSNALDSDWAHPRNKKHIGDRLAYVALSQYYGSEEFKLKDYGSPTVAKVEIKGSEALVYFKYVGDGLQTSNGSDTVSGFYSQSAGQYLEAEIAGKNCVKVKLLDRAGNSITGESFRLVYGTGAMADQSTCNLQNSNGIGALSFAYTHVVE